MKVTMNKVKELQDKVITEVPKYYTEIKVYYNGGKISVFDEGFVFYNPYETELIVIELKNQRSKYTQIDKSLVEKVTFHDEVPYYETEAVERKRRV